MLSTIKKMKKFLDRIDIKLSKINYMFKDFNFDNQVIKEMCPKKNDVEDDTYINNESKDKSTKALNTLTLIPIFNEFIPQDKD